MAAEAKAEEWRIHRLGQWLQAASEDGPLGRQPAPTVEPPPPQFNAELLRTSLERPWHRERTSKAEIKTEAAA